MPQPEPRHPENTLHSVVCVKVVPKPEEIRVDPETRLLERSDARLEINPPDMNALEIALDVKDRYGGQVSILSMGPPNFEPGLRIALSLGCDHIYLLSDPAFGGADTLATTYTLAQAIHKLGQFAPHPPSLIFCGEESSDGATGQVPAGLAEWLDIPQLTLLTRLDLDLARRQARGRREIKGGYEILEAPFQPGSPCLISVKTAANEPRFIDFRIKNWSLQPAQVTIWNAADLSADPNFIGLTGSPTWVSELAAAPLDLRKRIFIEGSPDQIADQLLTLLAEVVSSN
ncbi:MAG: electron transfer flavoprotein subunit beta/FixA family protein [Chloroflexota bacterium]